MPGTSQDSQLISLLCVDDDVNVLDILKKYFERVPDFSVFTCTTPAEALDLINQYQFDAIISDYSMPDMDGIKFLKKIRSQNDQALFIIFTGRHIAQVAIEALNNGGNYYVQKGLDVLSEMPKVEGFIRKSVLTRRKDHFSKESEVRYHSLLEQQADLLCSFLPDGSCTHANEAYARFIGRRDDEISGTNFLATIPKTERKKIQALLEVLTPAEPGTYIEHHALNSKGEPRLYQWGYHAFFNESGSVIEYLAQGRDLSNVLRLEEILPQDRVAAKPEETQPVITPGGSGKTISPELSNLADSVEQIQYPIFAIDKNGVVIAWNHAMAELTGVDARTMLGLGDYSYAFPIYGEPRPMLIDYILRAAEGSSHEVFPGLVRDGDSYSGEVEDVTIRGKAVQVWGKGTPIFDGKGRVIAAIQSLLVHEKSLQTGDGEDSNERYIGGISSIILKVAGDGMGGSIAGALGSTTGGYGVYATDRRLIVVHNPELDASRDNGIQFGEFIIDELFGITVDMRPRRIADLERIKVFEVWREDITAIELKTPRFLAGFLIIKIKNGSSFRIFVDHTKAFLHLEQLLNLFYPEVVRKVEEITDAELEWLDEIRTLELIGKLQLEDPFQDIPHVMATNLPRSTAHLSSVSVTKDRSRDLAETIDEVAYPVFAIDRQGIVIAWNKAIARLTGIDAGEMVGTGDFNYSFPFYGERKPMLIDYLIMPPDAPVHGELPVITRDGDTIIGTLESVTVRGKPMLAWGKATAIFDTRGVAVAAIQSILFSEQPNIKNIIRKYEEEQYLGGLSSTMVKVPPEGIAGSIAGALGSTTGGYGIYFTDQRVFVIHNPDLDASQRSGLEFGEFILDELFGTTVDTSPQSIAELTKLKVFEVLRKDILALEMKKPMLFAGHITFKIRGGELFRVYTDHKKAYIHFEQLLKIFYPEILRIE
jgi:PAS domain S-box-containing protein